MEYLLLSMLAILIFAALFITSAQNFVRRKSSLKMWFAFSVGLYLLLLLINFHNHYAILIYLGSLLFNAGLVYAYAFYRKHVHDRVIELYQNDSFLIKIEKNKTKAYFSLAKNTLIIHIFLVILAISFSAVS